jgi:hypothetical protein
MQEHSHIYNIKYIFVAFPWQQLLHELASVLRCTYIACVFFLITARLTVRSTEIHRQADIGTLRGVGEAIGAPVSV